MQKSEIYKLIKDSIESQTPIYQSGDNWQITFQSNQTYYDGPTTQIPEFECTLQELFFFLKHSKKVSDYIRHAKKEKVSLLKLPVRSKVLKEFPVAGLKPEFFEKPKEEKRKRQEDDSTQPRKRQKSNDDMIDEIPADVTFSMAQIKESKDKITSLIVPRLAEDANIDEIYEAIKPFVASQKKKVKELQETLELRLGKYASNSYLAANRSSSTHYRPFGHISKQFKEISQEDAIRKKMKRPESNSSIRKQVSNPTGPFYIIVPAALSAILTMYNAEELLRNGKFIPSMDQKKKLKAKPKQVQFSRVSPKDKQERTYILLDNPQHLGYQDWKRVIAIFTNGKKWEFKNWLITNPTDLFTKYKGFYLYFDSDQIPNTVRSWPIRKLGLRKNLRHNDKAVIKEFWKLID